jgi:hypothetical protein
MTVQNASALTRDLLHRHMGDINGAGFVEHVRMLLETGGS